MLKFKINKKKYSLKDKTSLISCEDSSLNLDIFIYNSKIKV